jgi:hypothetical protein
MSGDALLENAIMQEIQKANTLHSNYFPANKVKS